MKKKFLSKAKDAVYRVQAKVEEYIVGPCAYGGFDLPYKSESDSQKGLATVEYAIVTIAAAAFAGILIAIVQSAEVREMLLNIIRKGLSV